MENQTAGENEVPAENRPGFDDMEPPRLNIQGDRPTLLAYPLSTAPVPVKRASGQFQPIQMVAADIAPVVTTQVSSKNWRAPLSQLAILYIIGLIVIVIDQASKLYIESWLQIGERHEIIPGLAPYFQLTHTINRGAAFGMFQNGGLIFSIVAVVVAIIIIVYNHQLPANQNWLRLALGLQLGGALGNFIDRLRQGFVTDFLDINIESLIDFRYANWPIFNVADASIVAGVIVLVIVMIFIDEDSLSAPAKSGNETAIPAD